MSKSALRKELSTFTSDELVKVILDLYDTSKEARQYLEYFLNPDPDALLEKKTDNIGKEINRYKRGFCKARISVIKAEIKEFAAYGVGPEYVCRLIGCTLRMFTGQYAHVDYTEALLRSIRLLVTDFVVYANKNEMLSAAMAEINLIASSRLGTLGFRKMLSDTAASAVAGLAQK